MLIFTISALNLLPRSFVYKYEILSSQASAVSHVLHRTGFDRKITKLHREKVLVIIIEIDFVLENHSQSLIQPFTFLAPIENSAHVSSRGSFS